jgi:hypothetical protein
MKDNLKAGCVVLIVIMNMIVMVVEEGGCRGPVAQLESLSNNGWAIAH